MIRDSIDPTKSPDFDLITGKILQEDQPKCIKPLTIIYNAVLKLKYFAPYSETSIYIQEFTLDN